MIPGLLVAVACWLVLPEPPVARLRRLLPATEAPPRRVAPVTVMTLAVPVAAVLVLGPVVGVVVAVVVTPLARGAVRGLESASARRRSAALAAQLPDALDLLVAVLASGRPAGAAFAVVGDVVPDPLGPELREVAARLTSGADAGTVWDLLGRHAVLSPVARAFRRAEQSGVPVAAVVAAAADDLRRERRAGAREHGRAVGVRTAAPLAACFLPAFFCIGIVPTLIGVVSGLDLFGAP